MIRQKVPYAAALLVGIAVFGICATRSPRSGRPAGPPVLRLDQRMQKLPPAPAGTHVPTRFTLHNDGGAPLKISYLQSSCGCLTASLSRDVVPPGEAAYLNAEVLVPQTGRRESKIEFFANSQPREAVTLSVVAQSDVAVPYVVDGEKGAAVFSGWLTAGSRRTRVLRTMEKRGEAPWLDHFESDVPCVSVQLAEFTEKVSNDDPDEVEREYVLELALTGELPHVRVHGRLLASSKQMGTAFVASGIVVDPAEAVELQPSAVYLQQEATEVTGKVFLRSTEPDFELKCSVEQPLPAGIEVRPGRRRGSMQEFLISLNDPGIQQDTEEGRKQFEVVFLTNHPQMPRVHLPVVLRR